MQTNAIQFHEITLDDKRWMDEKFSQDNRNACEYTFANNFMWRKSYAVEVAEVSGCLVIRFREGGAYKYSYPVGAGDKRAVIEQLRAVCRQEGYPLSMSPLLDADRVQLEEWFPGEFLIAEDRDDFDYIYSREKLATLAGKKLHGKRNHIARFKDGGDWHYEPMTEKNLEDCRQMTYTWIKMRQEKWNEEMNEEVEVLHEAFDHKEELGLVGGVLYRGNEIVAFTLGEPLNSDTFVVHFEKAYPEMQGAYPMINQQFVQHVCGEFSYVNREEDTGDAGLRKAKLSYYPEILLKKYVAVDSKVVYANPKNDAAQVTALWTEAFGDLAEEVQFYIENRMADQNMLVIREEGKIVSMASFLPAEYRIGGAYVKAYYVYAVATLQAYRNRGYAAQILSFARNWYQTPLILAPAEQSLEAYYSKLGYVRAFREAYHIERAPEDTLMAMEFATENWRMEPVDAETYVKIRDEKLAADGYVRWDAEAVAYAMAQNERYGGKTVMVVNENEAGEPERDVLMYQEADGRVQVIETTFAGERLANVLRGLCNKIGAKEASYHTMAGMCQLPEGQEWHLCEDGYLGLTLA